MALRDTHIEGEIRTPTSCVRLETYQWDSPSEVDYRIPEFAVFRTLAPMPSRSRVAPVTRRWTADFEGLGFWPAETPLHFTTSRPSLRVLYCRFTLEQLERLAGFGSGWDVDDQSSCFGIRNQRIDYATLRLVEEVLDPGFGAPLIVESMGMAIAVELARHLQPRRRVPEISKGGLSARQFRRIVDLIGDGESECPTIADLAEGCGFSERHLMRSFKQTTGLTIGRYFEKARTERAIELLHQPLSVKEIAARLGFYSASHFAAGFRKSTGMTPTAYRRVIRT